MKKRLIASITSFMLLAGAAFCGASVPVHAAGSSSDALPEPVIDDTKYYRDPETGHIYSDEQDDAYTTNPNSRITPNAGMPTSYGDLSTLKTSYPTTRKQSPYGTCWAHAAAACAEFDLLKNHGMALYYANFSEWQLAYTSYHTGHVLPGLDGDSIYIPSNAPKDYLDVGGNIAFSMHTMAQWKAFTYEYNMPYSTVVSNRYASGYSQTSNWAHCTYYNAAQLENVRQLNIKTNPDAVKQAIMDQGAVYISYNHNSSYSSKYGDFALYYNPNNVTTNHDVVIVGWNDDIRANWWPAGNRPSSDGAWLVRNSWSDSVSGYSINTYFYMSYEDASLANTAYLLDFGKYFTTDNIYQYDGVTTFASIPVTAAANIFTANSKMDLASEKLDSVMLTFTDAENVNYKIEVYTGVNSSDPTSGTLNSQATTTGSTTSKGIYTIPLRNPVYLSPGEKYSIVVTSTSGTKNFSFEYSQNVTYNNGATPWFTTVAHADKGESFFKSNGTWYDFATSYPEGGNVPIKALTVDDSTAKYKITYNLNGGTNSSGNPSYFLSTQSGSYTLKNPTRSGYHFCGWYTDSGLTKRVTAINYNNKANVTLYAKWCSNSNKKTTTAKTKATTSANGSYTTVCSICKTQLAAGTSYKVTSIKLDATRVALSSSNASPKPVIKDSAGKTLAAGTDYTYSYNKSSRKSVGRYYVTIKFNDAKYNIPQTKLYFTVVPAAPSSASAKLYGYDDIKVSWSKCTGASGYYVYYKKSTSSSYSSYKTTTKNYIKFSNLSDNVKYNFRIVPYYKSGKTYYKSTKAKDVSAITLKKLAQPTMSKVSGGRVSLNWQCISGASGYQVYWSSSKSGKYKKLCDYSNAYIGVTFTVGAGKTYWYKTRAYKKVGSTKIYGPWSTPKAFKR